MGLELEFTGDAVTLLASAGELLAADPVRNSVVATLAERLKGRDAPTDRPWWWLVVRDGRDVVGAAMRTPPSEPFPLYLLHMPTGAAAHLAQTLDQRGESVTAVNGNLSAATECAEWPASARGGHVVTHMRQRQFEATHIVVPPKPRGSSRVATLDDVPLLQQWHQDFSVALDEEAGRAPGATHLILTEADIAADTVAGKFWFWLDDAGTPVNLTAISSPAFGVCRVGPVFTPAEHRGRGYAGHLVAVLSDRILTHGNRVCLYTDQANPTSNALYHSLGYRPLDDFGQLRVLLSSSRRE